MKKSSKNSSLTIESKRPWHTEFEGEITEIKVNGQKISDVHDLTSKVISMTKTIRVLAYTALGLAVMQLPLYSFLPIGYTVMKQALSSCSLRVMKSTTNKYMMQQIGTPTEGNEHIFTSKSSTDCIGMMECRTGLTMRW